MNDLTTLLDIPPITHQVTGVRQARGPRVGPRGPFLHELHSNR